MERENAGRKKIKKIKIKKFRLVIRIEYNGLRKPRFPNVVGIIKSNLIQSLLRAL